MFKTILLLILINSIIVSNEPYDLDRFVCRYIILHQGKMESSPVVWQELKEGHLRTKAIIYSDRVLDSLNLGYPPLDIAVRHFKKLEDYRWDVYESGDYNLKIKPTPPHMANYNYFSTSAD